MVASKEIAPGTTIEVEHLTTTELPPDYVPNAVLRQPEEAIGRVVREPILVNTYIREERLTAPEGGNNLGAIVPRGMRIIQLPLPRPATWPQPTDMIDIAYIRDGALCMALESVWVLYVETRDGKFESWTVGSPPVISVLLAVAPNQIPQLMAEEEPILMLRNLVDMSTTDAIPRCQVP